MKHRKPYDCEGCDWNKEKECGRRFCIYPRCFYEPVLQSTVNSKTVKNKGTQSER
ncbi:hypothetical protein [Hydrogenoanaerobacterium saccharovorans]|uniref:hypothetical protein n=1 Tax=Hydrogenoanaerobacterium saccharovorans TaxID=474960 RepID=UPI0013BEA4E3|nr:hypothetical protein [Hydrogenoanaerobacterium saccharovorans]